MARFLGNNSKIKEVGFHPVAEDINDIISMLGFTFHLDKVKGNLREIINSTIRVEGVLAPNGRFLLISPLFVLRIVNTPLAELLNKETIIYKESELSAQEIQYKVWGDFFKYLFICVDTSKDLSTLQQQLKSKLSPELCQQFFKQNFLSEQSIADITHKRRGVIAGQKNKMKVKTSGTTFIPTLLISNDDDSSQLELF